MRIRTFAMGALTALATSCSSPTEVTTTLDGTWRTAVTGLQVVVHLVQDGTQVSGTGTVTYFTLSEEFTVAGSHVGPSVDLTLVNDTYGTMTYVGSRDGKVITGVLNGPGVSNYPIPLTRD
jgi:hypothetical protein